MWCKTCNAKHVVWGVQCDDCKESYIKCNKCHLSTMYRGPLGQCWSCNPPQSSYKAKAFSILCAACNEPREDVHNNYCRNCERLRIDAIHVGQSTRQRIIMFNYADQLWLYRVDLKQLHQLPACISCDTILPPVVKHQVKQAIRNL